MNATHGATITTSPKTIFQSTNHQYGGFDMEGVTKFVVYNYDDTIYGLVKADGFHDAVEHAPPGAQDSTEYGTVPADTAQWLPVPPGGFVVLQCPKDPSDAIRSIKRVQAKAASSSITMGWGVLEHR